MKSLLAFGLLVAVISFVAAADYEQALKEIDEAFPGLVKGHPQVIKVVFDNGAFLDLGKNITPTESKNQPLVDWNADPDSFYTLVVSDPDPPYRSNPYMREVLTWMVGNIRGKDLSTADVISEYVGAAPPPCIGMNRYFYFLFKHFGEKDFNGTTRADKYSMDGRAGFSVQDFANQHSLGSPDGVNYLTAYYDEQTPVLYRQLNCCEDLLKYCDEKPE